MPTTIQTTLAVLFFINWSLLRISADLTTEDHRAIVLFFVKPFCLIPKNVFINIQ
jgi:hypothetical protein